MFGKQFGGKITRELIERYESSPNWEGGQFRNLEQTNLNTNLLKLPVIIYKQFSNRKSAEPNRPLELEAFDQKAFTDKSEKSKFIWYGHSAVLMRINGKNIFIDPMLGADTTPIAPISTKRFSNNTLSLISELPSIDLMVITHDHYDHLDFDSIQRLKEKTDKYFVALGIKRHLVHWGVSPELIVEFDWWESRQFENIDVTFTPTRHFSGRGLRDRSMCLWGGWAFKTPNENIWFSGDGGYGSHFKDVGERLGPFDFGFMECGQYNDDWHNIHMFPNEAVKAALDAKVSKIMPVHWGGFNLSYQHTWSEPVEHFVEAASTAPLEFCTPPLGKLFTIKSEEKSNWWQDYL